MIKTLISFCLFLFIKRPVAVYLVFKITNSGNMFHEVKHVAESLAMTIKIVPSPLHFSNNLLHICYCTQLAKGNESSKITYIILTKGFKRNLLNTIVSCLFRKSR